MRQFCKSLVLCQIFVGLLTSCATSEEDRRTAHYHYQMGASLLTKKQYPRGLEELLIAKKLDPSNPKILNHLGVAVFTLV